MRLALIHDYLTQLGGAEKVLQNFLGVFKESPVFVLVHDKRKMRGFLADGQINTSWLQKMPGSCAKYQWYLSLMPLAVESYKLSQYDVVLSSTSSFAKGVKPNKEA